jgi:hypothetical protein
MPGTAAATGVFGNRGAVATDDMALEGRALVATAVFDAGAPTWARPVAAIEIRLSVPVFCIGRGETAFGVTAVACDATVSVDAPAIGNWAGRFVSFR